MATYLYHTSHQTPAANIHQWVGFPPLCNTRNQSQDKLGYITLTQLVLLVQ